MTSVIEDISIWVDLDGAGPADDPRAMVEDLDGRGKRFGVEYHAYGCTAQRGKMVDAAFDGFTELVDASDLIRRLRLVKSPAEPEFMRKAGALCDEAWEVVNTGSRPGTVFYLLHTDPSGDEDLILVTQDGSEDLSKIERAELRVIGV